MGSHSSPGHLPNSGIKPESLALQAGSLLPEPPGKPSIMAQSHSVMSHSLDPMDYTVHGILQARILEWVAIAFSRGIFSTQGSNPGLPHLRRILYQLNHQGSPWHKDRCKRKPKLLGAIVYQAHKSSTGLVFLFKMHEDFLFLISASFSLEEKKNIKFQSRIASLTFCLQCNAYLLPSEGFSLGFICLMLLTVSDLIIVICSALQPFNVYGWRPIMRAGC